ncbi:MAG: hypothetical protein ACHP7M_07770 [Burkholderiales bacterium]
MTYRVSFDLAVSSVPLDWAQWAAAALLALAGVVLLRRRTAGTAS